MTHTSRFVGIDISKSSFDICILPERRVATFANTAEGICTFIALMADLVGIERLVIEPTGGYERGVVDALLAARLPVAKVNAKQVRQFARACGQLSKTDRIDAFFVSRKDAAKLERYAQPASWISLIYQPICHSKHDMRPCDISTGIAE